MDFSKLYSEILQAAAGNSRDDTVQSLRNRNVGNGIECSAPPGAVRPRLDHGPVRLSGRRYRLYPALYLQRHPPRRGRRLTIDKDRCVGCAECIEACRSGKLTESRDILPVLDALKNTRTPVYALVAPAFIGQFGKTSPGQLRSAFKASDLRAWSRSRFLPIS
jgi:ferredoxin